MALPSPLPSPNHSIVSSFSNIVTTKLTTKNYPLWKVQISAHLRGQDLYHYVDGTLSCLAEFLPIQSHSVPQPNPNFSSWKRTDQMVLNILFPSLSESVIGHVLSSNTSCEVWLSLASLFASHSQAN